MEDDIADNIAILCALYKSSLSVKRRILKDSPPEVINLLIDCALNILQGKIEVNDKERKNLYRHRYNLRSLVKKSTPKKKKTEILQKGGFLAGLLAPIVGSIAVDLLGNII